MQYPWPVSQETPGNLESHLRLASPLLGSLTDLLRPIAGPRSHPRCVRHLVAAERKLQPWQHVERQPFAFAADAGSTAAAAASTSCTLLALGAFGKTLEGRDQAGNSPRASAHSEGVAGAGGSRGGACWARHPFVRGCRAVEGTGTLDEGASRAPVPSPAACTPPAL